MSYSIDVAAARALATKAHEGQTDKAGLPYITHPERVALRMEGPELQVIGWLHDTVEDTPIALQDIEGAFGPETAAAVDAISRRDGEKWSGYLERVAANPMARQVKISDLMRYLNCGIENIPPKTSKAMIKKLEDAERIASICV